MQLIDHVVALPTQGTPFALTPLGCIHADDEGFDEDLYFETVSRILSEPYHYTIGVGDYTSLARGHYRQYLKGYLDDPDSQRNGLDPIVRKYVTDYYTKYLKPLRGRLWGLAEGNHHWAFEDGTTSTQMLCRLAGVPYLGVGSVHRLTIGPLRRILTVLVHHGDWGGTAGTTGGDINSAEKRGQGWDVDICIFAHTHRKHGWTVPVMSVPHRGALEVVEKPRAYIRAGSFTKAYLPQCVTYVERRLLQANSLGAVTLRVQYKQFYSPTRYRVAKAAGSPNAGNRITNYQVRFRVEH